MFLFYVYLRCLLLLPVFLSLIIFQFLGCLSSSPSDFLHCALRVAGTCNGLCIENMFRLALLAVAVIVRRGVVALSFSLSICLGSLCRVVSSVFFFCFVLSVRLK